MRKIGFLFALLGMCAFAQAGFMSFTCEFPDDPDTAFHVWNTEVDPSDGLLQLNLYENYTTTGSDSVNMIASTDEDPIVKVAKFVTNANGHDWTGYTLTLNGPEGVYFTGAAGSDYFSTAIVTPNLITFSDGVVAVGEEVTLLFRIEVADAGNFDWCVTQQAIPEPATLVTLGLGALSLLRRKKIKS